MNKPYKDKEHLCSHWERRFKNVNPGENSGEGSKPLKSIVIFKQA